jgi:hypothetical protein
MARSFAVASSQYLENAAAALTDYPVSMACWFQLAALGGAAGKTLMGLSESGGTARCVMQVTVGASPDFLTVFSGATGGGATASVVHGTTIAINTWYLAVGVFGSAASRICYLNTIPSAEEMTSVAMTGVNRTNIGARYNTTVGAYYDGIVAEAALWNVALTAADVAQLAARFAPPLVRRSGIVAYWPLIGRNSPENDIKGGFPLTLTNTPTTASHCPIIYPRKG